MCLDDAMPMQVAVKLNGLAASDVVVECIVGSGSDPVHFASEHRHEFQHTGTGEEGEALFHLAFTPTLPGLQTYQIRVYPYHSLLAHRFELGRMRWL